MVVDISNLVDNNNYPDYLWPTRKTCNYSPKTKTYKKLPEINAAKFVLKVVVNDSANKNSAIGRKKLYDFFGVGARYCMRSVA